MLERAYEIQQQLTDWRREFHMQPELGFHETSTAARVAEITAGLGYRVRTGVGRTGVVAERGEGPPVVAIRADMDALPIQDAKDVPYASKIPNVMHACGHDAHTAILLGVARLLAQEVSRAPCACFFNRQKRCRTTKGSAGRRAWCRTARWTMWRPC